LALRAHPLSVTGLALGNPRASPIRDEGTSQTGRTLSEQIGVEER